MRRPASAVAVCACLLAAACGREERPPPGRALTVPAGRGVRLIAREYAFDPAKVVATGGGGELGVTVANRGSLAHNARVLRDGRELGGSPTFQGRGDPVGQRAARAGALPHRVHRR